MYDLTITVGRANVISDYKSGNGGGIYSSWNQSISASSIIYNSAATGGETNRITATNNRALASRDIFTVFMFRWTFALNGVSITGGSYSKSRTAFSIVPVKAKGSFFS